MHVKFFCLHLLIILFLKIKVLNQYFYWSFQWMNEDRKQPVVFVSSVSIALTFYIFTDCLQVNTWFTTNLGGACTLGGKIKKISDREFLWCLTIPFRADTGERREEEMKTKERCKNRDGLVKKKKSYTKTQSNFRLTWSFLHFFCNSVKKGGTLDLQQ